MKVNGKETDMPDRAVLDAVAALAERTWIRAFERSTAPRRKPRVLRRKCASCAALDDLVTAVVERPKVPSFADLVRKYVREKCGGKASLAYHAAGVSKQAYSAMISKKDRLVEKRTAVAFALAFKLGADEARELVKSAGISLTLAIKEDAVYLTCIQKGIYSLFDVNYVLEKCGCRTLTIN